MHFQISLLPLIFASFAAAAPKPCRKPVDGSHLVNIEPIIYHPHPYPQPFEENDRYTTIQNLKRNTVQSPPRVAAEQQMARRLARDELAAPNQFTKRTDSSGGIIRKSTGPAEWRSSGIPLVGGRVYRRDLSGSKKLPADVKIPKLEDKTEAAAKNFAGWQNWFGGKKYGQIGGYGDRYVGYSSSEKEGWRRVSEGEEMTSGLGNGY